MLPSSVMLIQFVKSRKVLAAQIMCLCVSNKFEKHQRRKESERDISENGRCDVRLDSHNKLTKHGFALTVSYRVLQQFDDSS